MGEVSACQAAPKLMLKAGFLLSIPIIETGQEVAMSGRFTRHVKKGRTSKRSAKRTCGKGIPNKILHFD